MIDRPLNDAERWFAAEYAMNLTDDDARLEAERRMERDGAFRAEVETWQSDFEPLLDRIEPVRPPRRVWSALARRIGRDAASSRSSGAEAAFGPLRGLALFGVGSVLGALILLAVLSSGVTIPGVNDATLSPSKVAVLTGDRGEGVAVLHSGVADGAATLTVRHTVPVPTGRTAEAWVIPDGAAPVSLGTIAGIENGAASVALAANAPRAGTFAISIEPLGGSPEAGPTGPVVLTGMLSEM